MSDNRPHPLVLENRHTGERLELRRVEDERGLWLELKGSLPPHSDGPPLHVHFKEDEGGRVLSGTVSARVGGLKIERHAGEDLSFPRGVAHRWWNAGDQTLVFEGFARPLVDLDLYLQAVFEIVNAGPEGRPLLFYMAHAARRHRSTQAAFVAPRPVQAVLFPLLVGLGTLLGKYRGTEWPGCPVRCTGAPMAPAGDA